MRPLILLLVLVTSLAWGADSGLEQQVAQTDFANADSVFALGQWCQSHNQPGKARQYFLQVIKIDKDHEAARDALGQMKVGEHWVGKPKNAPASKEPAGDPAQPERKAGGPGPTAAEIKWDLTLPKDPKPENGFISKYIELLPTVGNDSREMDAAVATMAMDENVGSAVPRLCAALARPGYNDLYGASMLVMELLKKRDVRRAKLFVPFLCNASAHVSDPGDLSAFAFAIGQLRVRNAVPRLIELMETGNADVKEAAGGAIAAIAMLPEKGLTAGRAKEWWDLNHNVSDQQIYSEQLRNSDPHVQVEAAKALYEFRDKEIVPVLIKLLRGDDVLVCSESIGVIKRITGLDWGYDPSSPAEAKKKRADELDKWWKDNQFKYTWIEDRNTEAVAAPKGPVDQSPTWVQQLSSAEGNVSQQAEGNLRAKGTAAVPPLIDGLSNASPLVRRKCQELLREITKQEVAFDPRGSEEDRNKGIDAWKAWAKGKGLIKDPGEEGGEAGEAEEPAGKPEKKDEKKDKAEGGDKPAEKKKDLGGL